jgi:hypothetical protein
MMNHHVIWAESGYPNRNRTRSIVPSTVVTVALCAILDGCVMTGAAVHALPTGAGALPTKLTHAHNAGEILVSEGDGPNRPYTIVGDVRAWARSATGWSSNPTRADVDEALRDSAFKVGADAVIQVHYRMGRAGLAGIFPRGKMTGEGYAIVFKE